MSGLIDLTGKKFGRLTIIERFANASHEAVWVCKCDCGKITHVRGTELRTGKTKSCGCFKVDRSTKHRKCGTRLYNIWAGMKRRCSNPNEPAYDRYGGRGISVCEEWLQDFQSFYDWAMMNGYADDLTIDRKDNDKGYSPDNCRWATDKEQANNKRNNRLITFNGETHTIGEWASITGITSKAIERRLNRDKWDVEKALTTPLRATRRKAQ